MLNLNELAARQTVLFTHSHKAKTTTFLRFIWTAIKLFLPEALCHDTNEMIFEEPESHNKNV